jgi:hypothetical protein
MRALRPRPLIPEKPTLSAPPAFEYSERTVQRQYAGEPWVAGGFELKMNGIDGLMKCDTVRILAP